MSRKVYTGHPSGNLFCFAMEVVYPRMTDGNDTIFSFLLLAGYLTPADKPEETEIGYLLLTEYWSNGIMTKAVGMICETAFEE